MAGEAGPFTTARQGHVLRVAAIIILLAAVATIGLIAAGAFDPKPYGLLAAVEQPGPQTAHGAGETVTPLDVPWPDPPDRFSIRLTAAHTDGEADSGYGLTLGDGGDQLGVALSPLGYVSVWEEGTGAEPVARLPWQPWPHARPGTDANEIWLDVDQSGDGTAVTVWINRELLWRGEVDFTPRQASLYHITYGEPATVDFRRVEWFAEP